MIKLLKALINEEFPMKLVIASHNIHKIRELRGLLKLFKLWDIYSLIDFPDYLPPPETGNTFEENAVLKAISAAKALNCWALADDSGLIVSALNGPGIHSAHYAGEKSTDKENRIKLLMEMKPLKEHERMAFFECVLALASPEGIKKTARALCEGMIIEEERGSRGFGYDPIFLKHEYSKTFGELDEETKNRISHRRKAFDKIVPFLEHITLIEKEKLEASAKK